jgi:hypothetical protein
MQNTWLPGENDELHKDGISGRGDYTRVDFYKFSLMRVFGRFDGENYNIGFMDICNNPYKELIDAAKQTHSKMYEVAGGIEKPFDEVVEKIPPIHYKKTPD